MTDSWDDYEIEFIMKEFAYESLKEKIKNDAKNGFWENINEEKILIENIDSRYARNIESFLDKRGLDTPVEILLKIEEE